MATGLLCNSMLPVVSFLYFCMFVSIYANRKKKKFTKCPIYGTILTCSTHTCAIPQNKEYSTLQCGESPMNAEINDWGTKEGLLFLGCTC